MEKADDFYSSDEDDTQSSTTASEIGGPKFKVNDPCNQPPDLWALVLDLVPHSCRAQAAVQDPSARMGIICWALYPKLVAPHRTSHGGTSKGFLLKQ